MNEQLKKVLAISLVLLGAAATAFAHCQIPCGIYGDETRFTLMREHVATIEKSIKEIDRIGKESKPDNNQLVRWVMNKDSHADELAEIVTFYFMAQRVKPVPEDMKADYAKYVNKITLLHQILVVSMKAKQTTDLELCTQLRTLIDQFEKSYTAK
ncbi:MAG: superoxide dismutase [Desulfobacteraceae bacterium]|nr:MAG: superoxide dismutase [Desulfobacteraceae bacterium]